MQNFKKTFHFFRQRRTSQRRAGFTLIELLVVVVIIGILASLLMTNFINIRQRARDAQRKADLRQIQAALELYRADQGSYPTAILNCPSGAPTYLGNTDCSSVYMQSIPSDPLDNDQYQYNSSGTTYSITACLENEADTDPNIERTSGANQTKIQCTDSSGEQLARFKFTLRNP